MHKTCESTKRFGTNGWRLTIGIKGTTRKEAEKALDKVYLRIKAGALSGADSTDSQAFIFKLQEVAR